MNYNDSVYFILDDENHINNNEIKSKDNNIYYLLLDDETDIKTLTCVNITKSMKKNKICNLTYSGINKITRKCLNELKKMLLVNLSDNNLIKMYNFTTNTSHITDLLLNNNNICGTIYINNEYSCLINLNLSNNKITNIYIKLPKLENITLNDNKLISVNIITNVTLNIDLSNNNLKDKCLIQSKEINYLNLNKYLIESINYIGNITYYNNNMIKIVDINNDNISEIQLNNNIIEKCIIKGNNLVSLELSNNKLHDCIIECTNLMYLNLQSNYLTFINLDKCLELILINLFNNRFTNNFNIQKFCNKFKYLCEIELSNNNILFEKTLIDLQECSICLNEYKIFSIFIYCGHIICKNCYKVLNKCPICRANKYNSLSLKFNEYIYIDVPFI